MELKSYSRGGKKGINPKAIIPVDLFGLPAGIDLIVNKEHDLMIIEDALRFGGQIRGEKRMLW